MSTNPLIRREDRLLRLTLNRPEKRNALRFEDCQQIVTALNDAEADRKIGAILLDANGPVFCAGMDLSEALKESASEQAVIHNDLFTIGSRLLKPLVIAVQGKALAGGLGLIANAHVVLASDAADFALVEIRIGLWPFVVFHSIAKAIGERRAVELSLTGRTMDAREALLMGLIHQVAASAELAALATKIAAQLSQSSPEALRLGLDYVRQARSRDQQEAVRLADAMRREMFRSPDFAEGVEAFFAKREPRWPSVEKDPAGRES